MSRHAHAHTHTHTQRERERETATCKYIYKCSLLVIYKYITMCKNQIK